MWQQLLRIPYGETTTYGAIARQVALELNKPSMAGQAIGGAVGHNPISIIIPCHRVVGGTGSLTGYAGGLQRKVRLLALEGVDMARFSTPRTERRFECKDALVRGSVGSGFGPEPPAPAFGPEVDRLAGAATNSPRALSISDHQLRRQSITTQRTSS